MLSKVETTEQAARWLCACTAIPAARIGSAVVVESRHVGAVLYLAGGVVGAVTEFDEAEYNRQLHGAG